MNNNQNNFQSPQPPQPPRKKNTALTIALATFGIIIFLFLGLASCSVGIDIGSYNDYVPNTTYYAY